MMFSYIGLLIITKCHLHHKSIINPKCSISERQVGLTTKKESERRPRSQATHRVSLENFVGEEAPEARA
ncbi:MAG: hypothetical protein V3T23_11450, partial [Nitrososphaerales archaeon]